MRLVHGRSTEEDQCTRNVHLDVLNTRIGESEVCGLFFLLYLLVVHFKSNAYLLEMHNFYAFQMYDASMSFYHHIWVNSHS